MSNSSKPNVLLITTDQQRYDSLGVNGCEIASTPNIDGLAQCGVVFRHAFAQNSVCVPSRACIQTGRYTHQHGVTYMETVVDDTPGLPEWEKTFMEHLQDNGYHTAAFGKMHMYPPKGFDTMKLTGGKGARWTQSTGLPIGPGPLGPEYAKWLEDRHPGGYEAIYEQRRRSEYKKYRTAIENVLPLEEYVDWWIAENTIDYLKSRTDGEPFFIWCGFCSPHGPYDPPKPYSEVYPFDEMPLPLGYDEPPRNTRIEETIMKRIKSYYYGLVTLVDDMVGRIVKAMQDTGLFDNTLIIYTTDHGDMLGDWGKFGKGNFLDTIIRVPLIIKPPRNLSSQKDVDGLVELIDIAPTIFDYLGMEIPETVQGISLRPSIEGEFAGKKAVLSEYTSNDQKRKGTCLRTDRYKYCFWHDSSESALFDLQKDRFERNNVIDNPDYHDVLDEMRDGLLKHLSKF